MRIRSRGRAIWSAVVALLVVGCWSWPAFQRFLVTGYFFEQEIVERLERPVVVRGWTEAALELADGRFVSLPGIARLPASSRILSAAMENGVEIAADGRVIGLLKIHHWCGNDPVRRHWARVDLSDLLCFLNVGEQSVRFSLAPPTERDHFGEHGWRVNDHTAFQQWLGYRDR